PVVLHDEAMARSCAVLPYLGAAWTANTDTFGISRYADFKYHDPALHDGTLYAIGDNGIVAMDAADDEGEPIHAVIESGLSDFGQDALKNISYAYIGYSAQRPLCLTLSHVRDGLECPFVYDLPERW